MGGDKDDCVPDNTVGEGYVSTSLTLRRLRGKGWGGSACDIFAALFRLLEGHTLCVRGSSTPRPTFAETLGPVCAAGARGTWKASAGSKPCLIATRTWSRDPSSVARAKRSYLSGRFEF